MQASWLCPSIYPSFVPFLLVAVLSACLKSPCLLMVEAQLQGQTTQPANGKQLGGIQLYWIWPHEHSPKACNHSRDYNGVNICWYQTAENIRIIYHNIKIHLLRNCNLFITLLHIWKCMCSHTQTHITNEHISYIEIIAKHLLVIIKGICYKVIQR